VQAPTLLPNTLKRLCHGDVGDGDFDENITFGAIAGFFVKSLRRNPRMQDDLAESLVARPVLGEGDQS